MRVLYLAAEAAPFAKVGGLADVAGSLPLALRALPAAPDVRLALPLYPFLDRAGLALTPVASFDVAHSEGPVNAQAYHADHRGLPVYFIDGSPISSEQSIYSGDNLRDGRKFVFFSLAALELARALDWPPDVLHANDWHTAPAVYGLSRSRGEDDFFPHTASLLSVHNLPYLGEGTQPALTEFGLPPALDPSLPGWGQALPLPLGLLSADHINAVSPGYAAEIMTAEFGAGLHEFLKARKDKLSGILNGLDTQSWDPETDSALPVNFGLSRLETRSENKVALQTELGLEVDSAIPVLAVISRLAQQKGIDLVFDALPEIENQSWQLALLGAGDSQLEGLARFLASQFPQRVSASIKYDDALARRIYAGSDMILIPSRYEPCGLTQMIAMRYGCIPVARAVGGLKDTIDDHGSGQDGTGFLFSEPTAHALAGAISRALSIYSDQAAWHSLQRRAMAQDFSWANSAQQYDELYQSLIK